MTMDLDDLERLVDAALKELPSPRAPRTLRARVREAIQPRASGHPWFTWPWPLQAAAVLLAVAAAGLLAWQWPALVATAGNSVPRSLQASASYFGGAAETSAAVGRAFELTWSAVIAPLVKGVLLVTLMLCTACAVCLAALSRVALGGASRS
jgi:hypothetical protein